MAVAKTSKISVSSRASVKVGDSFYTVEYSEERTVPTDIDVDIEAERAELWDVANNECDNQIQEILRTFRK